MAEDENKLPQPETDAQQESAKSPWQMKKENWYDKIPLNVKQLDIIIGVCWALLALTAVLIFLEAKDIFHLFG